MLISADNNICLRRFGADKEFVVVRVNTNAF